MQHQTTYYRTVPVSEKPKEEGWYDFLGNDVAKAMSLYWQDGQWRDYEGQIEASYEPIDNTHYLQPIPLPDAERLREALEACFNLCERLRDKILSAHIHEKDPVTGVNETTEVMRIAREALSQTGDGWVRVEDRLPKAEDADERGYVMTYRRNDRQWGWPTSQGFSKWKRVTPSTHTHWRPLPSQPIKQQP